jgi:aspartate/methionine/tyrosine aminotransferase
MAGDRRGAVGKNDGLDLDAGATLTRHQWEALRRNFNLADGHSRQSQSRKQMELLRSLPAFFEESIEADQEAVEAQFFDAFFGIAGQATVFDLPRPNLHYSASVSIAIAAAHLRALGGTVMCIHPTFDNIPALLARHGVPTQPIDFDDLLALDAVPDGVSALVLVLPNNPTGDCLDRDGLMRVARLCAKHDIDLVIDFSFRFASNLCTWDQYAVLAASEARFVCIEDTGKTWPVLDLKVGMTVSSPAVADKVQEITEDYILNVSPFLLRLLTTYIESDPERSWLGIARENREALEAALAGSGAVVGSERGAETIAWVDLGPAGDSDEFCRWANGEGVAVCPGGPFFWDSPEKGSRYIRVALLRPKRYFAEAVALLRALLDSYSASLPGQGATGLNQANAA